MAEVKDGGPAFPLGLAAASSGDIYHSAQIMQGGEGMSLRDWFAGQALCNPNICTGTAHEYELRAWFGERNGVTREEILSRQAHNCADAMLAERENGHG